MRIKKKIEADINELEIELDRANKANAETAKAIKRAAANLLEVDTAVCEEAKARADIQDQAGIAERKGIQHAKYVKHTYKCYVGLNSAYITTLLSM